MFVIEENQVPLVVKVSVVHPATWVHLGEKENLAIKGTMELPVFQVARVDRVLVKKENREKQVLLAVMQDHQARKVTKVTHYMQEVQLVLKVNQADPVKVIKGIKVKSVNQVELLPPIIEFNPVLVFKDPLVHREEMEVQVGLAKKVKMDHRDQWGIQEEMVGLVKKAPKVIPGEMEEVAVLALMEAQELLVEQVKKELWDHQVFQGIRVNEVLPVSLVNLWTTMVIKKDNNFRNFDFRI